MSNSFSSGDSACTRKSHTRSLIHAFPLTRSTTHTHTHNPLKKPTFFLPISHQLVEHHDIWTVWAAARLAHCLFMRLDPVLSAQSGDTSSSVWTPEAPTHPGNLSSQPHTHLWACRRFTGFYSPHMDSPDASFLLFLRSFPLAFPPSSSLLPSRAGHCRPVRSAPTSIWKPHLLPIPLPFTCMLSQCGAALGGDRQTLKASGTWQGECETVHKTWKLEGNTETIKSPPPRCSYISRNSLSVHHLILSSRLIYGNVFTYLRPIYI